MTTRRVLVAGAGLAGLTAAISLVEAGVDVALVERRDTVGGASRESAGWIWRYNDMAGYRTYAPGGSPEVQQAVLTTFDDAVEWLAQHGVAVLERDPGRSFTAGIRIDTDQAFDALVAHVPDRQLMTSTVLTTVAPAGPDRLCCQVQAADGTRAEQAYDAVVLAGGGYASQIDRIATEAHVGNGVAATWVVRPQHGGDGSTIDALASLRVRIDAAHGECFTRLVPDTENEKTRADLLIPFGELGSLPDQHVVDAHGNVVARPAHDWSGAIQAWMLARQTGRGWIELRAAALAATVHAGPVRSIVAQASALGLDVRHATAADGSPIVRLPVVAGLTHTRGGLVVSADGAVSGEPRLYAVGADARDIGIGGTAGGLAQALVLGRRAALALIGRFAATA